MPYCTRCKEEYIDGIKRCRVCGDALIDNSYPKDENTKKPSLPQKKENEYIQGIIEVLLFETINLVELHIITNTLKQEGIPFIITEGITGHYMHIIYNFNIFGKKVYVSAQNYKKAKEIFDYISSNKCEDIDYDETLDKITDRVLIRYLNRKKIIVWGLRAYTCCLSASWLYSILVLIALKFTL